MTQLNTAFYCFAPLEDLSSLRQAWRARLGELGLKGTIILAPEGVNGFLAGSASAMAEALRIIRSLPPLSELTAKESVSESIPFEKLCIKLKKEIVTFRVDALSPPTRSSARIQPAELAAWYAQGEDFIAIDTRNAYESKLGTFEGAHAPAIDHFVDFAEAAKHLPAEWKKKKVVTFCTGGIRCEKAAPYLESLGFEQVWQLDGGILKYFEQVGGVNWQGECFVFDQRVALGPNLLPTEARLCVKCQGPIPRGSPGCIHCEA